MRWKHGLTCPLHFWPLRQIVGTRRRLDLLHMQALPLAVNIGDYACEACDLRSEPCLQET